MTTHPEPVATQRASVRELPADLLTPVGAYMRIRDLGPGFLLESIERGQQVGRYSFLSAGLETVGLAAASSDPFSPLRDFLARYPAAQAPRLPPFVGGVVGHLAYDAITGFEPTVSLPPAGADDIAGPSRFLLVGVLVAFDHVHQRLLVIAQPGHEPHADIIAARLSQPLAAQRVVDPVTASHRLGAEPDRDGYLRAVAQARAHIHAGDAFQVVVSQRHLRRTQRSAMAVYRALRTVNPSPYMFLIQSDDLAILGASPETHVSLRPDGTAELRPIAGTRRRGTDPETDDALAVELQNDAKENAEHMMLVDLARNDLSRVCRAGTVRPTRLLRTERYSHVMHLVSHVEGHLADEHDAFSLLRATFPAGTVSGAPKVRAMQIISSLETCRRGIYAGAVGWVSVSGSMDTCIALRTVVMRDGVARLQAGAGIVADSDPASEHQECLDKIAALDRAIDLAETGVYGP